MKKKYLTLLFLLLSGYAYLFGQTTFNYTGAVQFYTVPCGVTQLIVDVKGAQGNINANGINLGGKGGEVQGTMTVVPCEILQIYVGGGGTQDTNGGWNGGGNAGVSDAQAQWAPAPRCPSADAGGGGGASDIRTAPYSLADRQVVGGGGGGTGGDRMVGCGPGAGGGGGAGYYGGGGGGGYSGLPGVGGSQVAGGAGGLSPGCSIFGGQAGSAGGFGFGGWGGFAPGNNQAGSAPGCQGGDGGTLVGATGVNCTTGGCPGTWSGGSGGGGSNWQGTLTAVFQTQGVQTGNGIITITPIGGCIPLAITSTVVQPTCGNCNGSITITATGGSTPYTYLWSPGGQTTATITGLCGGFDSVTVTDACGSLQTFSVTLNSVNLSVNSTVTANEPCNGNCVGSATTTIVGGVAPFTYAWTPTGGTNANASALCAGIYTITATDINGCNGTATVTITQPALLTTTTTFTNALCFGGNSGTATAVPVGGTPTYTYSWSNGNTNVTATGLSAGSYTVTVTDANGCNTTATATISQPGKMSVTATGPQLDCSGNSINLTATPTGGTAPFTYSWTPGGGTASTVSANPPSTTTYSVTVTDSNGCSASTTFMVTVEPALTISVTGKTSTCAGGPISLIATGSGGDGNYTYHWLPSNKYGNSLFINPTVSTSVTVELTDGCGSAMATLVVPITVNPTPKVSFSSDVVTGCSPLCVQFRDLTTIPSGGIYQWGWNFGNGDSTIMQSPIYCYKDTGKHSISLTVTSDSGCSGTLTVLNLVDVYPSPNASFTYSPQPVSILNPLVQFTDQSTGQYQITDWLWRFTDGIQSTATSTLRNPTHNYSDTGTFCASLVVMDQHGCMDSLTSCFVVNPLFTFYIPDAFSPNGDGVNDVFLPKGSYIKNYEMYIFDRWGMKLFYSNDITVGWNGKSGGGSGIVAQEDTYVYLINVTDSKNNKHTYNGKVNLIK